MRLALEAVNVRVGAEQHLAEINLRLEPGSLNMLLGPTQAGKTTLMRVMAGLDRPTSGRVLVDGADVTAKGVRERNVAMVYQQFVNYPSFTVFENIASPLRQARRFGDEEIRRRVVRGAEMMHIEHLLDRLPADVSGGQQQRTAIARALVKEAGLLLLDEPLVNLDYKLREELRAELRELFSNGSTTVVYATTEPTEALMMGGQTAVLDRGRVLQTGPTIDVYHRPTSIRVAEIFSDPPINIIPARLGDGECRLSVDAAFAVPRHMAGLAPGEYRVGIRANHVSVERKTASNAAIPVAIELAEISGSETFVHGRHGAIALIARIDGVHEYRLGQRVTLHFDPARLFAFDRDERLVAAPESPATTQEAA
jgi:glycerol transport system ATP-binding protein